MVFNVNYALFIKTNNQSYMPNKFSYLNPEHIEYFKFAGSIIARALLEGKNVNAHLSMSFLRQILRRKPKLKDIEDFDETLYKSFQYFLENDIDPLEMTFSIDVEEFGEQKTINLIENGEKVLVTNENKHEYLSLYASYHLSTSIQNQIEAFREGFDALIHPDFIKMFSPSELDLLICGIPDIDIDDMIENTEFEKPYNRKHPVIKLFFSVISKWENDDLGKFLLFLTGSSQVPINGFKDYKDKGKPIKIMPGGGPEKYPVAHTCFNSLALPEYDDEYEMDNKLKEAIQVCEFGIA